MVHALKDVHRLLRPGGILLNVHDLAEPSAIDVRDEHGTARVGRLDDDSDYALLRAADAALDQVTGAGLFAVEARRTFAYVTHMDSLAVFDEWYAGTWESTTIAPADYARLAAAMHDAQGQPMLVIHRRAQMSRLRRN